MPLGVDLGEVGVLDGEALWGLGLDLINIAPGAGLDSHADAVIGGRVQAFDEAFAVLVGGDTFEDLFPLGFDPDAELDLVFEFLVGEVEEGVLDLAGGGDEFEGAWEQGVLVDLGKLGGVAEGGGQGGGEGWCGGRQGVEGVREGVEVDDAGGLAAEFSTPDTRFLLLFLLLL